MKKFIIFIFIYMFFISSIYGFDMKLQDESLFEKIEDTREKIPKKNLILLDKLLVKINNIKNLNTLEYYEVYIKKLNNLLSNYIEKYKKNEIFYNILNNLKYNIELINKDINKDIIFLDNINIEDKLVNQKAIINYYDKNIIVYINKPKWKIQDVFLIFHWTTMDDKKSEIQALIFSKKVWEKIMKEKNIMTISVAYKETDIYIWDELKESKLIYLWLRDQLKYYWIQVWNIYLLWHSRGGYIVSVLNTLYKTGWVIANWAWPLNLAYTCTNYIQNAKDTCDFLLENYWTVEEKLDEYKNRSVIKYMSSTKTKMLIIQWDQDKEVQMKQFPVLKNKINSCNDCEEIKVVTIKWVWHNTFNEDITWSEIFDFINN